jgi:D-alanyl-D-alanine carboxypeptidase
MKNKNSLVGALVFVFIAVVTIAVMLVALGGCKNENKDEKPSKTEQSQQEEPSATPGELVERPEEKPQVKPEEKPDEEPEEDPVEEPKEEPVKKPTSTVDNSDLPGYKGNATVSQLSKAQIEKILNDPYMILVNRDHVLPKDYAGYNLVSFNSDHQLNDVCTKAMKRLMAAGKDAGYNYVMYSGYRSYSRQYNNYYNKINSYKNSGYSEAEAIRLTNQYYAPPGASEHHTGLAADVCIPSIVNKYACLHENYEYTDEFKWFSQHAHEYGFILRYTKGDESITGYNFEPWHYRYVGVDIATEIYRRDITLEEYIGELEARLEKLS